MTQPYNSAIPVHNNIPGGDISNEGRVLDSALIALINRESLIITLQVIQLKLHNNTNVLSRVKKSHD